tara:strand:- start:169 stop:426 length:258 start_codon:yes stop_codon:yes gene_type:complete
MNAEQRKSEWDSLSQPKPSWESFKRLVSQFDSTKIALIHWEKMQRRKFAITADGNAPQRMIDEFIIFTDHAPIEMLCDFDSWVSG